MTIADHIRAEVTFQHIRGLIENGLAAKTIAKVFKLPLEKVQDIIQKIKDSSN